MVQFTLKILDLICFSVSAKTIFATISFLTVMLFSLTVIDQNPLLASEKESDSKVDPNNNNNNNLTQYYACTDYAEYFHCDRSLGEMRSYQVKANWVELYKASDTPMFTEGKYEKALMLQSKRLESVEINNNIGLNPKEFSVSFWIKPQPMSEPSGTIISHSTFENNAGWSFKISNNSSVSFEIYDSGGKATVIKDKSNIPTDRFANIVGTFDGTKVRMYVDGHLASDKDFTGRYANDPVVPLRIGGVAGSMGHLLWTGVIDDLAFYNRSLSNSDIDLLSSSNTSYHATNEKSGLIGHWSFDNDLADSSSAMPFHNDGILRTLIASMAFSPDGRLFFTEKDTGNIRVMVDDKVLDKPFASIKDHHVSYEQGLLGLAVDPSFEKNHFVYVYYTAKDDNKVINKIVRFTDVNNSGTDPIVLLDDIPALDGYHSGGALAFGPDGKLYIGVGDATLSTFAQNPSISLGKVLRVNKDGTIPADNPYPNSPVYTLGHRNIFGIAFDNKSDIGIIAENGDELYDEINIIEKGGNYGFPTLQPPNLPPELANPNNSILPVKTYWKTPGPTQAIFYEGNKFPEIKDSFLIGAVDGSLYSLNFSKIDKKSIEEVRINPSIYPFSAVTSVAESPTGNLYFGSYSIYKITGLDYSNKEQITFPVKFDFSNNYTQIDNVKVFKGAHNSMQIDFHTSNRNTEEKQAGSLLLSIEIPKKLLNGIYSVNMNGNVKDKDTSIDYVKGVDYTIDDLPASPNTIVKIRYSPSVDYSISILGDNFMRENSRSNGSSVFEGALNKSNIDSNIPAIKNNDPKTPSPLSIEIKSPLNNFTFLEGKIKVIGNSASNGHKSNIQKVEISYHSLTENKTVPYKLAKPISPGDWSEWTFDLVIDEPGYYKILARVTDNKGEQGWDSGTIQIPFFIDPKTNHSDYNGNGNDSYGIHNKTNIPFVEDTFTQSAYSGNGFYKFYYNYPDIPKKVKVTSDLTMVTTEIPDKPSQKFIQIRSPPVEIAAPLGGEILNDVITKPIATIKDIALSHTNKDSISKIKKVEYKIDNSNYQFAKTFYTNHWSDWDTSLVYPSYGNHEVLNKVTYEYENTYGSPENIFEVKDKFGIQKIYPTKQGGREWYVNMENPRLDNHFLLGDSMLEKQSDGSWETGTRITGDDEYDEGGSKYHLIMGVDTLQGEDEWRDVEITGYFKIKSIQSDEPSGLQWYARGGNHSDDNPCDGTSLKGRILYNGTAGWKKEIWHDGGYTEQRGSVLNATSTPLEDRWIGWKVIMYNINENKAVKMESYIDDDNNNTWKKVSSLIDDGKWYASSTDEVFYSANCGNPKDYIVTNSGSIAAFRSDGIIWDLKNLSVREITPLHHSLQY